MSNATSETYLCQPNAFSIKFSGVDLDLTGLEGIGVDKLKEMRKNEKSFTHGHKIGLLFTTVLTTGIGAVSYLFHQMPQQSAHEETLKGVAICGFLGARFFSSLLSMVEHNRNAKNLYGAVAMVAKDMQQAEFTSTGKKLVEQGYFSLTTTGNTSEYKPLYS